AHSRGSPPSPPRRSSDLKAPLYIDDSAAPAILELRARARRFRQDRQIFPPLPEGENRRQLGLIVVDYLQLCRGGRGRYDIREQEIGRAPRLNSSHVKISY